MKLNRLKERIPIIVLLFLGSILFFSNSCLKARQASEILSIAQRGISFMVGGEYGRADSCWKSIPPDPKYDLEREFYPVLTIVAQYTDLERPALTDNKFLEMVENVIDKAKQRLKIDENDVYARFYLGYAYEFLTMYYYFTRNLPSLIVYGLKGMSELKKCVKIDSTFAEPYIVIGSYTYWRSSYAKKIYIPFSGKGRDKGIEIMKKGVDSPLGDYLVWNQLSWIYIDYKKYNEAIKIASEGLERYPKNRILMEALAIAYKKDKKFDNALITYSRILKSLELDGCKDDYKYYKTLIWNAEVLYEKEDYEKARLICMDVLETQSDKNVSKRYKKVLKYAKKLSDKCREKLKGLNKNEMQVSREK